MKLPTQILQHILITSSVVFLSGLKSPAKEYFVAPNGSDDHTGTLQQPFGTIQHAVQRLGPGDTLFLRAGRYHETVTLRALCGGKGNPVTLTAYAGESVTWDGSEPITSKWIRHKGPIYKTFLDHDIWQLFVNGKGMSSARWPNGNWNDGSLWDSANSMAWPQPERSEFGHHFNDGLKQLDFSLEGGIIIVASGSFKTYKSRVIKHQAGSDNFVYSLEGVHQHTQGFSVDRHAYFLEGKLAYMGDAPDIGPYEYGDKHYWIPGCQYPHPSRPVPPDGSTTVKTDADLMFLGGYKARRHSVYFGGSPATLQHQAELTDTNIFMPPLLKPGKTYYWRVDAVLADDKVVRGSVWQFTVRSSFESVLHP